MAKQFELEKKATCQVFEVLAPARQERYRALHFMAFIVRKGRVILLHSKA